MKRYIWIVVLVISVLNICGCGLDKPKEKDTLPLETSSLESFEKDSKTEEQSLSLIHI